MKRKTFPWVAIFVIVVLSSAACGARTGRVKADPSVQPKATQALPQLRLSMVHSGAPFCFDPNFLGGMPTEWFENVADDTVHGRITDRMTDQVVCEFYLKPGQRMRGPAIWAHDASDGRGWHVSGDIILVGQNDRRTVGATERAQLKLEYQPRYGWYFMFFTKGGR